MSNLLRQGTYVCSISNLVMSETFRFKQTNIEYFKIMLRIPGQEREAMVIRNINALAEWNFLKTLGVEVKIRIRHRQSISSPTLAFEDVTVLGFDLPEKAEPSSDLVAILQRIIPTITAENAKAFFANASSTITLTSEQLKFVANAHKPPKKLIFGQNISDADWNSN